MKTTINILLILFLLGGTACQHWLDVKPKTEIKSDVLFETEAGFKDALTGVYLLMSRYQAYGMELTVGFNDVLAQQYTLSSTFNAYYYDSQYRYDYARVEDRIAGIWVTMYNVIANVNNILENLETHKGVLHPVSYGIIKGECLGLRAFLHFDLLRLFGYGNLAANPANLKKLTLPYVKQYDKAVTPQLDTEHFLQEVLQDLDAAYALLLQYDPYSIQPKEEDYYLPNDDQYFSHRNKHFNYFALRATQARVYSWMGNRDQALACAREVITRGTMFAWIAEQNITSEEEKARDLTFSTEHLFGLNIFNLHANVNPFINPDLNEGNMNYDLFYHTKEQADEIYEIAAGIGNSDYRYTQLYRKKASQYTFLKFLQPERYQYPNNMPVIKKPEAYYIAAECLNETGVAADRELAIEYLNVVREHRGIARKLDKNLSQDQVNEEIYKEYRKEFISEGQMFYYYKRLGYSSIPGAVVPAGDKVYKIPMPKVEIDFGGRND